MDGRRPGPAVLWLVRHGESLGNVADARAHASGAGKLQLDVRDPDVELSATGRAQARALGRHLTGMPADQRPTVVLSSPFARARHTAELAVEPLGLPVRLDERLRERDFGAFDGMTGAGIREQFPEEARRRQLLGKFYYRPPGGESWADVALRIRSVLSTEAATLDGGRVLVVAHNTLIRLSLCAMLGIALRDYRRVFPKLDNVAITEVEITGEVVSLLRFNRPVT